MRIRDFLARFKRPPRTVNGGTITSIAGGFSGVRAGITITPDDRARSVMRSEHSRVGKSRFRRT